MSHYQPTIEQRLHEQGYDLIRFEQIESEKERISFQPTDRNGRVDYQI